MKKFTRKSFRTICLGLSMSLGLLAVGVAAAQYGITGRVLETNAEDVSYNTLNGSQWQNKHQTFNTSTWLAPLDVDVACSGIVRTSYYNNYQFSYIKLYWDADNSNHYVLEFGTSVDDISFDVTSDWSSLNLFVQFTSDLVSHSGTSNNDVSGMYRFCYSNFLMIAPPLGYSGLTENDLYNDVTSLSFYNIFDTNGMPTWIGIKRWNGSGNIYYNEMISGYDSSRDYALVPWRISFYYGTNGFTLSYIDFAIYGSQILGFNLPNYVPFFSQHGTYDGQIVQVWKAAIDVTTTGTSTRTGVDNYSPLQSFYGAWRITGSNYYGLSGSSVKTYMEGRYLPTLFVMINPVYIAGRSIILNSPEYNASLYQNGYETGYDEGYYEGQRVGYVQGQQSVTNEVTGIVSLFGAIVNVPINVLNGLSGFTIWNVPIIHIIFTFLFVAVFAWIIRRFI